MQTASDLDKRKWLSILCHASVFVTSLIIPILIPVTILFISDDRVVKANAKESINFQFNVWFWGAIVGGFIGVLSFLSFGLLGLVFAPIIGIGFLLHWGLSIWASLKCLNNPDETIHYPFILRVL